MNPAHIILAFGLFIGQQAYQNSDNDPRVLVGIEMLAQRGHAGAHVAIEHADLADFGNVYISHWDAVYRHTFNNGLSVMAGGGLTLLTGNGSQHTWNAEAEVAKRFGRTDVFARVRQYDYEKEGFRAFASPSGPAVYVGVRWLARPLP